MAKVINRSKETIHFGGHVLGTGEHEIADIDALIKQHPGLDKLVEVIKPVDAPKSVEPEPDVIKHPAKEQVDQPKKEAPKKAEK
jgi:hypothetical protein